MNFCYLGLGIACLVMPAWGEVIDSPMTARSRALTEHCDVLYVYSSQKTSNEIKHGLQKFRDQGGLPSSPDHPVLTCIVDLPTRGVRPEMAVARDLVDQAAHHSVRTLPTFVLCDRVNRPYFYHAGLPATDSKQQSLFDQILEKVRTKEDVGQKMNEAKTVVEKDMPSAEKIEIILKALEEIPAESWFSSYPDLADALATLKCQDPRFIVAQQFKEAIETDRKLVALLKSSQHTTDEASCLKSITQVKDFLDNTKMDVQKRQCALLTVLYPLYVNAQQASWQDVNSPKNEAYFNQAIDVLEKARDLDPNSYWGREAHRLREELRRARLNAAKFD